jgi:hypothetical protein
MSDDLTTFIVPRVKKFWSLNLRIPKDLLRPVAGKLYLRMACQMKVAVFQIVKF